MTTATILDGREPAETIRSEVAADLDALRERGVEPTLATALMSDASADVAFMDRKHDLGDEFGIATKRVDVDPDAPAGELYRTVEDLGADDDVTALFVQVPLPAHVDPAEVRARVPPAKDVDCFNPENVGRLVAGVPRIEPVTARAVRRLLAAYHVGVAGRDVVVVGRSDAIGKPLANMLLRRGTGGDATVTVCHSRTADLGAHTRRADVLVTAAGAPGLVDGSMVSEGVSVVDVSANRVEAESGAGHEVVGDVDFEDVVGKASAITPVPGGVGPMTLAMLLRNVDDLAEEGARDGGAEP